LDASPRFTAQLLMANAAPRICVVGSINVDLTFRAPRLPRPGETLAGHALLIGFGGKGANQAVAAARLGARVAMVGKVGRDFFGQEGISNLRAQGIDTAHVQADPEHGSGVASIVVDDAAQNTILVVPGANRALSPADVKQAAGVIQSAAALLCQLEVPLETSLEACRLARAAGVRTILNPAPAAPLPDELLQLADLCVPNETEAELLTGRPIASLAEVEAAARALLVRGPRTVIVTLGERGAFFAEAQYAGHVPAPRVQAVDPTGAGDAFIGSLAVFLAEGLPLHEAVRRANAGAAMSVTRLGAQTSFRPRVEAEAFLARGGP
jgi:ribokinase